MHSVLGVIPVRYNSSRFPGKAIAELAGKPMVQWVWEAAAKALKNVVVATDDARISETCLRFGARVVMTSGKCKSGTDRVAEVARKINAGGYLNIQGDEPLVAPQVIKRLADELGRRNVQMVTAAYPVGTDAVNDSNTVKVVMDKFGSALYFSRSVIPFERRDNSSLPRVKYFKHLGIYGYKKDVLLKFTRLSASEMEKAESLEQLRALYHGIKIKVVPVKYDSIGVDTPGDLKKAEDRIRKAYVAI